MLGAMTQFVVLYACVLKENSTKGLTLCDSSSALCLAVRDTDLSANNLARRNSIVVLESSMPLIFLVKELKNIEIYMKVTSDTLRLKGHNTIP